MSEEDIRRMVEEATKEAVKQSFTEAGNKFLQAAIASEQKGDYSGATEIRRQAAENFWKAANEYRASKSFKAASFNMCRAGDVYSDLSDTENALNAYEQGANDLFSASMEHLMWNEDAETKKGTALAIAGSMIFFMIGKEDEAFSRAKKFASDNASKLHFPGVVRLSQIPQLLESAINAMDLSAFAEAENAAVTELKAVLASAKADAFNPYVDKGVEMVREILRSKLKVPKISSQLELPIDMTFKEEFEIRAIIENKGDGAARNAKVEWQVDDGLDVISGEMQTNIGTIPSGETRFFVLIAKSKVDMEGMKEFSVLLRGNYSDDLNTEYSLQAGPGTFILKDFKETEKLQQDVDVTESRVSLLQTSIDDSEVESEPLQKVVITLESSLNKAREEIEEKELASAKARIGIVNSLVDTLDRIISDQDLISKLLKSRQDAKEEFAKTKLESIREAMVESIDKKIENAESENSVLLTKWDDAEAAKKELLSKIDSIKENVTKMISEIENAHSSIPMASSDVDPLVGETRTKARTALDSIKSSIESLSTELSSLRDAKALKHEPKPDKHPEVQRITQELSTLKEEISKTIEDGSKSE